jgi:drug/metabolite transporter (DMT)-like permease
VTHASLLLTAMLWGGNFAALRFLLNDLAPLDVVFVRAVGAGCFFALALLLTGRLLVRLPRRDALTLAGIGLLGVTVLNLAATFGQARLPASLASLIVTSNPVHTAVISRLLTGEPLTRRKVGGIALAFVGLLIVLGLGSGEGTALGRRELVGVGILALAPFSWAFYTVLSKPLLATYPSLHVAAYTTIAGAAPFLVLPALRPGLPGRLAELDSRGWGAVLFTTLLSFVVAYVLWYRGLRVLTPSQTAVYVYLVPVFGLLSAWLVLGERPTVFLLLGGATILAGVILTNSGRAPREAQPRIPRDTRPRPVE